MKKLVFEWQKDGTCHIISPNGEVQKVSGEQLYAIAPGLESLANTLGYEIEVREAEE